MSHIVNSCLRDYVLRTLSKERGPAARPSKPLQLTSISSLLPFTVLLSDSNRFVEALLTDEAVEAAVADSKIAFLNMTGGVVVLLESTLVFFRDRFRLVVKKFNFVGSAGADTFGRPRPIELDVDISSSIYYSRCEYFKIPKAKPDQFVEPEEASQKGGLTSLVDEFSQTDTDEEITDIGAYIKAPTDGQMLMSEETKAALRALPGWSNDKAPGSLEDRETSSVYDKKFPVNSSDSEDAGEPSPEHAHSMPPHEVAEDPGIEVDSIEISSLKPTEDDDESFPAAAAAADVSGRSNDCDWRMSTEDFDVNTLMLNTLLKMTFKKRPRPDADGCPNTKSFHIDTGKQQRC